MIEQQRQLSAERFLRMFDRQNARRGSARQTAADGGDAGRDNLKQAKPRGLPGVAFSQEERYRRCRDGQEPLRLSPAAQLSRGIEAGIARFKRVYGGARCT